MLNSLHYSTEFWLNSYANKEIFWALRFWWLWKDFLLKNLVCEVFGCFCTIWKFYSLIYC
jgi:hypothetical protein